MIPSGNGTMVERFRRVVDSNREAKELLFEIGDLQELLLEVSRLEDDGYWPAVQCVVFEFYRRTFPTVDWPGTLEAVNLMYRRFESMESERIATASTCRRAVCADCRQSLDPVFNYMATDVRDRWLHGHPDPQEARPRRWVSCPAGPIIEAFNLVFIAPRPLMGVNTGAMPDPYPVPYSHAGAEPPLFVDSSPIPEKSQVPKLERVCGAVGHPIVFRRCMCGAYASGRIFKP